MSRCDIKKAVVAASLGLAMGVTSPAFAGPDELVLVCESTVEEHVIKDIYGSGPLTELPPEVKVDGNCLLAWQQLKSVGYFTAGPQARDAPSLPKDDRGFKDFIPLVTMTQFTCTDTGTCLVK